MSLPEDCSQRAQVWKWMLEIWVLVKEYADKGKDWRKDNCFSFESIIRNKNSSVAFKTLGRIRQQNNSVCLW